MSDGATGGRLPGPLHGIRVGLAVVRGASMTPTLRAGDRLLVVYGAPVRPGRIVVARFANGVVAVKRAVEQRAGGWWLLSDNPDAGTDSRHRGAVAAGDVLGVVRLRVWPRPRRL